MTSVAPSLYATMEGRAAAAASSMTLLLFTSVGFARKYSAMWTAPYQISLANNFFGTPVVVAGAKTRMVVLELRTNLP